MKLPLLLSLTPWLAQAASKVHTGFNYGAFWGEEANVKRKADFLDGFNLAKNLSTNISFDSARLFTCRTGGTLDEPTEAFDAAVETKTNLLLGFWITPGKRGEPPDENVKNELAALEKGFQKHGQALSDLIIGLSIGNEDIYRWNDTAESGVAGDIVLQTIDKVKKAIAASSFAKYMEDKPIGHVDTAQHALVDNTDFIGVTAYPYWHRDDIKDARTSFHGSLESVKQHVGNTPVWIAEMGWPYGGPPQGNAVASAENMQNFWTEVGCSVFGTYTTFWFELLQDSTADQPDWGLIDAASRQPRIKDLNCPAAFPSALATPPTSSQVPPTAISNIQTISLISMPFPSQSLVPTLPSSNSPVVEISMPVPASAADLASTMKSTIHVNTTVYITVQPTPPSPNPSLIDVQEVTIKITTTVHVNSIPSPSQTPIPKGTPYCVTVADVYRDGKLVTVAGGPAGPDGKCSTPPTYNGFPYATSDPSVQPTHVSIDTSLCVTMADIDRNGHSVPVAVGPADPDGECSSAPTYNGWPYVVTQATSVPQIPRKSGETVSVPLSTIVVSPSSQTKNIPTISSSTSSPSMSPPSLTPSAPLSSQASVISTPAIVPTSNKAVQSILSSVHPYCQRKLSKRSQPSAASPLSAPPTSLSPTTVIPRITLSLPRSTGSLRGFNWPKPSAKSSAKPSATPQQRRWLWLLRNGEEHGGHV
ncbi:Nn.00g040830.m01.CDS01 [Neocucurbitaria sp. VM-36]